MSFQCKVVTPERAVLDVEARSVVFPAHDGTNRAPLLTQLGIGPLRVETGVETHPMMIDGGFAQMVDNKLTLLTEQVTRGVRDRPRGGAPGARRGHGASGPYGGGVRQASRRHRAGADSAQAGARRALTLRRVRGQDPSG